MAKLTTEFIEGMYYVICQKYPTNSEVASIIAHAKSVKDAICMIRRIPQAERFFNQFNGLSCNWIDHLFCVGEEPSNFQATCLVYAGINRFVDLTEKELNYFESFPENVSYYKTTISNEKINDPKDIIKAVKIVMESLSSKNRVYLHCHSGFCRSAIIAAIVIGIRSNLSYPEAIKILKLRRPIAQPSYELLSRTDADAIIHRFIDN